MDIKISRAFSKKVQLHHFEPIESFCSAEVEYDVENKDWNAKLEGVMGVSEDLDKLCRAEVEKTLNEELAKIKEIDKVNAKDIGKESAELDTESLLNEE